MKAVFHGERNSPMHGSGLSGAYLPTPPDDQFLKDVLPGRSDVDATQRAFDVEAWMELWDYAGGASFRAFVARNGIEKSLFVFFDVEGIVGRDLKKA